MVLKNIVEAIFDYMVLESVVTMSNFNWYRTEIIRQICFREKRERSLVQVGFVEAETVVETVKEEGKREENDITRTRILVVLSSFSKGTIYTIVEGKR